MITLLIGKIKNRKLLNLCLLFGIVLFISVAICTPMFEYGSYNRLLQSDFDDYIEKNNREPIVLSHKEQIKTDSPLLIESCMTQMQDYSDIWEKYLPAEKKSTLKLFKLPDTKYEREYDVNTGMVGIYVIPDAMSHLEILSGEMYGENEYECVILQSTMDYTGILSDETITLPNIKDKTGTAAKLKVTGIAEVKDVYDEFWITDPNTLNNAVLVSESLLQKLITNCNLVNYEYSVETSFDYRGIDCRDVEDIKYYLEEFGSKDRYFENSCTDTLIEYSFGQKEIEVIIRVVEIPMLALLLFFIYTVTGQILSLETAEIALLRSRGYYRKDIILLYGRQAAVLSVIGIVISIPIGMLMCVMAAMADGFMTFTLHSIASYRIVYPMFIYALIAAVCVIAVMIIPVIGYSDNDVVGNRKNKMGSNKSFIQKYYIDVILVVVTGYLMYNYVKQTELLAADIISGKSIDGMMFLGVSFFIFSCAVLSVRLTKYAITLVYRIGNKKWAPNLYASFLELQSKNTKRDFICIFIVFTLSSSIFQANLASTINTNSDMRVTYDDGADIVIMEKWIPEKKADPVNKKMVRYYVEPDYSRFEGIRDDGCSMTRVIRDNSVTVRSNSIPLTECEEMAINTKEFGESAIPIDGLNSEHYYNYLNALAGTVDGVLISRSIADYTGALVGERIVYEKLSDLDGNSEDNKVTMSAVIVGIFDAWPGYKRYEYKRDDNGAEKLHENHLIVTNYANDVNCFGIVPYEIWVNTDMTKTDGEFVREYCEEAGITLDYIKDAKEDIAITRNSSKFQITNGLFSLEFVVSILACTVGMLIYWISSMKQREMLFGIYRAMGMSMKEVVGIIVNEQIFASVTSWLFGGLFGILTSVFCVKLLATVYLPYKHSVPLNTVIDYADIVKLLAIVMAIIILCIYIMKKLMQSSNMAQAIKMGED